MDDRKSISRTSSKYRVLFIVLFFLVPLFQGTIWYFADSLPKEWVDNLNVEISNGFTPTIKILAFLVSMIKGVVLMFGLWTLIRLFGLYEKGEIFLAEHVLCFRHLSRVLIWWVIAGIVTEPLLSIILTMNNPPGQHMVRISFQSADLTALIVGGILSVITRVMADGQKIQKEMELTI